MSEQKKEKQKFAPGFYEGIPNDVYHGGSLGTSSSQLKKFCEKTAAHYLYDLTHPKPSTEAMNIGTAAHTMILEPENFDNEIAVSPVFNLRTKAGKADKEEFIDENAGKLIINKAQHAKAHHMSQAVLTHSIASALLEDTLNEVSVFWWYKDLSGDTDRDYKEMMKVRPDALGLSHSVIIDIKTTNDASFTGFSKSILHFYYHLSAAMYLEGCNQCKPLLERCGHFAFTKFIFICVENEPPYEVAVYELSKEFVELGKSLYRRAVKKLSEAREEDYPGYEEDIRIITPPTYANKLWIV